ncbi:N-acetylmuramoyl-L-alanine amidase [Ruminococcus sp.]|uniref:N-acetylmuramoyl-L-alanine amidase family protein n=1 Tax=Ruminococcus sp. TaxID=41978 RepID=UPI0025F1FF19|nr:N-acetylmuramoyl-L-alanine amidase [Ruminococcus sp.]
MQSDRQPTSRKNTRRVRYDRLLAVLLILILLIVLLVKCCSSCSSNKKKKQGEATTPTTAATEPTTEGQDYSNVVYLSPSNQADNEFTVGDTNEAAECRLIAQKTAAILEQSGLTVIIAGETDSLENKTAMGDNGLAAYVAIHTNAGTGVGTDCFYNSASEASKALAQAVYDPVAALTPTSDRGLMDGSQNGSDSYQYEIGANKSPCCLIEVEFHDGPNVAQWILDNEDNIATAIATGICNYLQVTPAGGTVSGTSAVDGDAAAAETTTVSQNAIQDQLSAGN